MSPFLLLPPALYCWTCHHRVWNILLVSWGRLSQLRPLPTSCAPPAYSLAGQCEKKKRPWHCVRTAQQWLKHPCVINTVFSTNPKHSPIQATMKKINPIPAKTSTCVYTFPSFQHHSLFCSASQEKAYFKCSFYNINVQDKSLHSYS